MITSRCCRHIGDRIATLTDVDGSRQQKRCCGTIRKVSNRPQTGGRIVRTLSRRIASECDTCWQLVCQRYVGCSIRAIIGDCNLKRNHVTFIRSRVSAGKRFNCYKISGWNSNSNGFFQVIANGRRVSLITRGRRRNVRNRVATLTSINCTLESQRRSCTVGKIPNRPQTCYCIVSSLSNSAVKRRRG